MADGTIGIKIFKQGLANPFRAIVKSMKISRDTLSRN